MEKGAEAVIKHCYDTFHVSQWGVNNFEQVLFAVSMQTWPEIRHQFDDNGL